MPVTSGSADTWTITAVGDEWQPTASSNAATSAGRTSERMLIPERRVGRPRRTGRRPYPDAQSHDDDRRRRSDEPAALPHRCLHGRRWRDWLADQHGRRWRDGRWRRRGDARWLHSRGPRVDRGRLRLTRGFLQLRDALLYRGARAIVRRRHGEESPVIGEGVLELAEVPVALGD